MNDRLKQAHASRSAAVKAGLAHPVIDTDVHPYRFYTQANPRFFDDTEVGRKLAVKGNK
ncbi:MAG TPA: hypothetical protein VLJ86_12910 [Ramlibacter sp.]|nr:hypothetical protein [Ramlibacter sp.]